VKAGQLNLGQVVVGAPVCLGDGQARWKQIVGGCFADFWRVEEDRESGTELNAFYKSKSVNLISTN
jgi:hypothetical protein